MVNKQNIRVRLTALCLSAAIGLGFSGGAQALSPQAEHQQWLAQQVEELKKITPLFIEDQRQLAKIAFFQPSAGKADGTAYLNQLEASRSLLLPKLLLDQANLSEAESFQKAKSLNYEGLDFGWMQELKRYDHLSLDELAANQAALKANPYLGFAELQLFPTVPLVQWAKLRLMQGIAAGHLQPAVADFRQLAYLLLNSEYLIGQVTAVHLLQWEQRAHTYWLTRISQLPVWEPFPAESLQRLRRVVIAAPVYYQPSLPAALTRPVLTDPQIQLGMCSGAFETSFQLSMLAFFPERQERIKELAGTLPGKACHSDYTHRFWEHPEQAAAAFVKQVMSPEEQAALENPQARQQMGYVLENIAMPDLLKAYRELL